MNQRLLLMHQVMLSDGPRLRAYDRALEHAIGPDDVVVDVGAGTLVLSMLALRHGAGHVYAIEADPQTAAIATRIAQRNDLKGRLTVIQGDARAVQLPRKADVLVSEMMGNLGPEEEMLEILHVVARRNLRPGGRVVPQRLRTTLTAIEFDDEGWGVWREDFLGYRLDVVQDSVEPAAQLHFFQRTPTQLSAPVVISDGLVGQRLRTRPGVDHRLRIERPGRLHAIMGHFTATLAPGITLSNFPSYPGCNWAVWIWPLRHTTVAGGDVLHVQVLRSDDVRSAIDWRLDCRINRQKGS
jgi:protein arginine N-methyltransferase 1